MAGRRNSRRARGKLLLRCGCGHGICDSFPYAHLFVGREPFLRRHFGNLSARGHSVRRVAGMTGAILFAGDLRQGIRLAFAVPETHVASAVACLSGTGPLRDLFSDEICGMFGESAAVRRWLQCAGVLNVRLELGAGSLYRPRTITGFYQLRERRPC